MIGRIVAASNEDARRRMTLAALNVMPSGKCTSEYADNEIEIERMLELQAMGLDPRDGRS